MGKIITNKARLVSWEGHASEIHGYPCHPWHWTATFQLECGQEIKFSITEEEARKFSEKQRVTGTITFEVDE